VKAIHHFCWITGTLRNNKAILAHCVCHDHLINCMLLVMKIVKPFWLKVKRNLAVGIQVCQINIARVLMTDILQLNICQKCLLGLLDLFYSFFATVHYLSIVT